MATSTAAQGKVYYIHSNVCMCLPDVSCSWPMLLGGDGDKEREHHPTRMRNSGCTVCICLCVPCHMDMLPRGVLLINRYDSVMLF